MPAITRNQQKMMTTNASLGAMLARDTMVKCNTLLKSEDTFKTNETLKKWFISYTSARLKELKELHITLLEYNKNAKMEFGSNIPEHVRNVEKNYYFDQLRVVNEMYYNINMHLEDVMKQNQEKSWLKLLKIIFIKQKELSRDIMISLIEPSTDEEIIIVKTTLFELEKSRTIAIRLLPTNEFNDRPNRRSIKPVSYREMVEDETK